MAKTKTRASKPKRSRNGIRPVSSTDARDLADYLAAKARDNGGWIPMAVVHRKAS